MCASVFFLSSPKEIFFSLLLERGKEKERNINQLVASCVNPDWGSNLKLGYVPWSGIEPPTIWLQVDAPTSWATLIGAHPYFYTVVLSVSLGFTGPCTHHTQHRKISAQWMSKVIVCKGDRIVAKKYPTKTMGDILKPILLTFANEL